MYKKKILFLLHIPPPVHGSSMVGKYIFESSRIDETFNTNFINLLASKRVSDSGKVGLIKIFSFLKVLIQLTTTLIRNKPDLCYFALTSTGSAFYRDVILVFIIKAFKVKLIYHLHNKGIKRHEKRVPHRTLYKFVFKNTKVILLSKYLYSDIKNFVKSEDVSICANGIPNSKNSFVRRINENKPAKILFLSNLIETKGVYQLIEACHILKERGLKFHCEFIGGIGDISISDFQQRIELYKLNNYVSYLGKKYDDEKEEKFLNANMFVFPTYYPNECLPLVIIEAMKYHLPVISTFEGGIRDLVNDNNTGYLVQQKDVNSLADKIEILIRNTELRYKMGEEGYKKYSLEFTLLKFETNLVKILKNCLS